TGWNVLQVTWQKEVDGAEDNIATYSAMNGQKIAKGYIGHVSFAHSELQASAISLHGVTLQDEGCYKCIFNTFPSGAVTGRMCLNVYVEAKLIPSPDKAKDSQNVVRMSCSATGKPAPKITWHLPSILQQKPREYHIGLGNQSVTVISNFTHAHAKILQEYPIACVIQHPSLNGTLVLPMDSLAQGQYFCIFWSFESFAYSFLIASFCRGAGLGGVADGSKETPTKTPGAEDPWSSLEHFYGLQGFEALPQRAREIRLRLQPA
uniref:Ig-like domain-containing protein n=1 Tax=Calidris pygmaea TaxID=425635 RepID=A0A8C3KHF8_9CHAR